MAKPASIPFVATLTLRTMAHQYVPELRMRTQEKVPPTFRENRTLCHPETGVGNRSTHHRQRAHTRPSRNKLGWGPSNTPQRRALPHHLGEPHEKSLSRCQVSTSAESCRSWCSRKPRCEARFRLFSHPLRRTPFVPQDKAPRTTAGRRWADSWRTAGHHHR